MEKHGKAWKAWKRLRLRWASSSGAGAAQHASVATLHTVLATLRVGKKEFLLL